MSTRQPFGTTPAGETVELVTLQRAGVTARIMTWGASLQDFRMDGVPHSLVLGSPDFAPYLDEMIYFGAIVGPVANRITAGKAPLGNETLELERNEEGITTLHSGSQGTSQVNWQILSHGDDSCTLIHTSPDGTGGLPGPITLKARYQLAQNGALELEITAEAEQDTFCNPAHHSYWKLDEAPGIHSHRLQVFADRYLPLTDTHTPIGAPAPVAGSRFDYRKAAPVLVPGGAGLDHNFCLRDSKGEVMTACIIESDNLQLEVSTTEVGVQVYDGVHMSTGRGHHPHPYSPHSGVAIEPQGWPDAPNNPDYPSILLKKGAVYRQFSRFHVTRKSTG